MNSENTCKALNTELGEINSCFPEGKGIIVVPQELLSALVESTKAAYEVQDYYEDLVKQYRDDKLSVEFKKQLVIPGVNGPRPEHQHLSRDTAVEILEGMKLFKGQLSKSKLR